jgi:solute carrier family 35 protein E3
MAMWHFTATFLVLLTASRQPWRLFKPIRLPVLQVLPISAFFASFLVLNNLSLAHNPVGFYQLSKILTTPSVVALNFILFRKTIPREQLMAVAASCIGVGLVSVQSFKGNALGTGIACMAFTTTACYQIWIGKKMIDLKVDAPQLLLNQSVTAVALLIPVSLVVDTFPNFCESGNDDLRCMIANMSFYSHDTDPDANVLRRGRSCCKSAELVAIPHHWTNFRLDSELCGDLDTLSND